MSEKPEEYHTSDLYYAAYLKTAGVKLTGTHRVEEGKDKGRLYFLFGEAEPNMMRDLRNEYYNRTAKVAALSYKDEILTCKQLTHED